MCVIIRRSRSSNKARDIWRAPLLPPPSPLLRPGCEEAASALRVLYKMLHLTLLPSLCTHIRIDRGALHAMRLCSRNNNTHTYVGRQCIQNARNAICAARWLQLQRAEDLVDKIFPQRTSYGSAAPAHSSHGARPVPCLRAHAPPRVLRRNYVSAAAVADTASSNRSM